LATHQGLPLLRLDYDLLTILIQDEVREVVIIPRLTAWLLVVGIGF
jgi:hypothetical protein